MYFFDVVSVYSLTFSFDLVHQLQENNSTEEQAPLITFILKVCSQEQREFISKIGRALKHLRFCLQKFYMKEKYKKKVLVLVI